MRAKHLQVAIQSLSTSSKQEQFEPRVLMQIDDVEGELHTCIYSKWFTTWLKHLTIMDKRCMNQYAKDIYSGSISCRIDRA